MLTLGNELEVKCNICNADMRVGEIRQFCRLPAEAGALTTNGRVEVSKLDAGGDILLRRYTFRRPKLMLE